MSGTVDWIAIRRFGICMLIVLLCVHVEAQERNTTKRVDAKRGPDVVLRETSERTIYEYRLNGQLNMIKVVPKKGKPYFLVPVDRTESFGDISRAQSLKPQWVIKTF